MFRLGVVLLPAFVFSLLSFSVAVLTPLAKRSKLHHFDEEVLVTQLVNVVEVLLLPSHVLYLAVNPFLDEFLGGVIIGESRSQFAEFFDSTLVVVGLDLLFRVIVERELDGLHCLLQLCRFAAELYQTVENLFCLVPLFLCFLFPFVGELIPAVQTVVRRESEMLFTVSKPYCAQICQALQCFFFFIIV